MSGLTCEGDVEGKGRVLSVSDSKRATEELLGFCFILVNSLFRVGGRSWGENIEIGSKKEPKDGVMPRRSKAQGGGGAWEEEGSGNEEGCLSPPQSPLAWIRLSLLKRR